MTRAFTLIELLVVITIIVVLLALLTPALDKAIYQAELAVDGANQKTIATGVTVYSTSFNRRYPHRRALNELPEQAGQPMQLNDTYTNGGKGQDGQPLDDRTLIQQYVPLAAFLDPLCDKVDLDTGSTQSYKNKQNGVGDTPPPFVYSGYQLFYGWRYKDVAGQKGMMKQGDRFSWAGTNMFKSPGSWTFDVLVADQNSMTLTYGGAMCSHPDDKGLLVLDTKQNEPYPSNTSIAGVNEGFYYVLSRWGMSNYAERRGKEDINTARTDASVVRMDGVAWDDDERVASAPLARDGPGLFDYWLILPQP
jgi:prepilin-type N-terminal cleavage/methylation domain-containing protein